MLDWAESDEGLKQARGAENKSENAQKDGREPNTSEQKETSGEKEQIKEKRMRQNSKLACFPRLITGCACQAIKQIIKQQLKKEREQ